LRTRCLLIPLTFSGVLPAQASATQFTVPPATTLDLGGQWRISQKLRINACIANLIDRKVWNWSDVRGLSATSGLAYAYS